MHGAVPRIMHCRTAFQSSWTPIKSTTSPICNAIDAIPSSNRTLSWKRPPPSFSSRRRSCHRILAWLSGHTRSDSTVLAAAQQLSSHVYTARGSVSQIIAKAKAYGIQIIYAHVSHAASYVSSFAASGLSLRLVGSRVLSPRLLAFAGVATVAAPVPVLVESRGNGISSFLTDKDGNLQRVQERDTRPLLDQLLAWLMQVYLPRGFPHTTTPDYISFTKYRTLQNLASAVMSVISTKALLFGLGLGKKVAAGAAATSWVLKDGASYVAKILYGSVFGSKFDDDPKSWRIAADIVEDVGGYMELVTPLFPMAYFLPLASLAVCLRGMSLMTGTATRHVVYRSLAANGMQNTGDIATKGESQGVTMKMLGLGIGIVISNRIGQNYYALLAAYTALAGVHIIANWRSVQCVQFSFFNKQRASILIQSHLNGNPLPSPYDVSHSERIILPPWRGFEPDVKLGAFVSEAVKNEQSLREAMEMFKGERFLVFDHNGKKHILLRRDSTPDDALRAYYVVKKYLMSTDRSAGNLRDSLTFMRRNIRSFEKKASAAGWDMRHMLLSDSQARASW